MRYLSIEEYALYTLSGALLALMNALSESGITNAMCPEAIKALNNPDRLGQVLASALHLRRRFSALIAVILLPILGYLLRLHGASWITTLVLCAGVSYSFVMMLSTPILELPCRLHRKVFDLSRISVGQALARLLFLAVGIFALPVAAVAMVSGAAAQGWTNRRLRSLATTLATPDQIPDRAIERSILKLGRRSVANTIYYCVSGQITIFLISVFGNVTTIAQVGALGRIGQIMALFTAVINGVIVPSYARLSDENGNLLGRFIQVTLGTTGLAIGSLFVVYLFPSPMLWLLGEKYAILKDKLVLAMAAPAVGFIYGIMHGLGTIRGWIPPPHWLIPVSLLVQVALIPFSTFSTVSGVLWFALLSSLGPFIYFSVYFAGIARSYDRTAALKHGPILIG